MADLPLFTLDAGHWRLAHDARQWVLQRRKTLPRPSEVGDSAEPHWRAVSFIGSEKRALRRCIAERGVVLCAEAHARLDVLPERFDDFIAEQDGAGADRGLEVAA